MCVCMYIYIYICMYIYIYIYICVYSYESYDTILLRWRPCSSSTGAPGLLGWFCNVNML